MRRRKPINADMMVDIEPLTANQKVLFDHYDEGKNIFAYGAAGTGKTFISLFKALRDVLDENTPYEKLYIVRSLVSTREIGFLPGDHDDKSACIRSHIRIWFDTCSSCLQTQTLKCSMVI